jgi:hypothetical protein
MFEAALLKFAPLKEPFPRLLYYLRCSEGKVAANPDLTSNGFISLNGATRPFDGGLDVLEVASKIL